MIIPLTSQTASIARRIIWFEDAETALADPVRFLAYAAAYATHEDMKRIRSHINDDDFRDALDQAPPGIIDARSWTYWNLKLGRHPAPPMPTRKLLRCVCYQIPGVSSFYPIVFPYVFSQLT